MAPKSEAFEYPPLGGVLYRTALSYVRGPLFAALLTCYVVRPYLTPALVGWFARLDLSWAPGWLAGLFADGKSHTTLRDTILFVSVFIVTHEVLYFGLNSLWLVFDRLHWFQRYKLPRTKRMLPSDALMRRTVREGCINHFVFQPVTLFLVYVYIARFGSLFASSAEYQRSVSMSLGETALHFFGCTLCNEVGFYVAHRLFHIPFLYKAFHKKHHEFVGTTGFAAEYAHPVEQLLANQLPTIFYTLIWRSSRVGFEITWVWLAWRVWETYEAHSGYYFHGSWLNNLGLLNTEHAIHHDWHHTDNRGNFGSEFLDYICGTMDSWAEKQWADAHRSSKLPPHAEAKTD